MQTHKAGFAAAKGGCNRLLTGLPTSAGWLMEALLTFVLVFVVFTATDQARAQSTAHLPILAPAGIGFAVFTCHLAGVALDGCSINRKTYAAPCIEFGIALYIWTFSRPKGVAFLSVAVYTHFCLFPLIVATSNVLWSYNYLGFLSCMVAGCTSRPSEAAAPLEHSLPAWTCHRGSTTTNKHCCRASLCCGQRRHAVVDFATRWHNYTHTQ